MEPNKPKKKDERDFHVWGPPIRLPRVRPFSWVGSQCVEFQGTVMGEAFATDKTLIGLFTCVASYMPYKKGVTDEPSVTNQSFMRHFFYVTFHMQ